MIIGFIFITLYHIVGMIAIGTVLKNQAFMLEKIAEIKKKVDEKDIDNTRD